MKLTSVSPEQGKTNNDNLLLTMADGAPSRAVIPAVAPEVALVFGSFKQEEGHSQ